MRDNPAMHNAPLHIGMLIYPEMDQIDFTGPFEVFSRIEGATVLVMAQIRAARVSKRLCGCHGHPLAHARGS